jgi:ABC-type multidrug transport system fused ATPase/permease subunit
MSRKEIKEKYLESAGVFGKSERKEDRTLLWLSVFRLLTFAGGFILGFYLILKQMSFPGIVVLFVSVMVFMLLLKSYSDHLTKKEFFSNLSKINSDEAAALNGDLSNFDAGSRYIDTSHDFSYDVDLFGEASLFRYLNRTVTSYGRDILAKWISDPYSLTPELSERQEIIRELSSRIKWRQEFIASGMGIPLEQSNIEDLLGWMKKDTGDLPPFGKILIYLLPAAAITGLILLNAGVIHYSVFVLLVLVNLTYVSSGMKKTNEIHRSLSGRYTYLSSLNRLMHVFSGESFNSAALVSMQEELTGQHGSASFAVKKLSRLLQSFDSRLNILVGFGLNGLLLWDYHCIMRLNRWKAKYKSSFPIWLGIIGKVDAYSSLANFAYNNPTFAYPGISQGEIFIKAEMLGHPLIDEEKRVNNDFRIEKEGDICIITGANMAGKSTFLRTVAVNLILGMTGSPVCAGSMRFTPVKLFTSMRTTDSLSGNESYFYAELKRLRSLKSKVAENEPLLFILDEILKGTNSTDKALGSRLFVEKLVLNGGTGMIATHDLSLGELEKDHQDKIFNMCFEIEIDGESIRFDYKLKPGMTKKMNAALLMKQMGILD